MILVNLNCKVLRIVESIVMSLYVSGLTFVPALALPHLERYPEAGSTHSAAPPRGLAGALLLPSAAASEPPRLRAPLRTLVQYFLRGSRLGHTGAAVFRLIRRHKLAPRSGLPHPFRPLRPLDGALAVGA